MVRRGVFMAGMAILVVAATTTSAGAQSNALRGRCISELAEAGVIGRGSNPGQANIVVGTEGDDDFGTSATDPGQLTDGVDLVCGFGGDDTIECCDQGLADSFSDGDVFLGGAGNDAVVFLRQGSTFFGGAGDDRADWIFEDSTFHGGDGADFSAFLEGGTFNGGDGPDELVFLNEGTFNGDAGEDVVTFLLGGTFNGGEGVDSVAFQTDGTFNQ